MPLETIASAVCRTVCSFTLHANLFQLFQPIGGVSASPLGALFTVSCLDCADSDVGTSAIRDNQSSARFIHLSLASRPPCVSATNPRCKLPIEGENRAQDSRPADRSMAWRRDCAAVCRGASKAG